MSIAEKSTIISANNVTITENEQKVYNKGCSEGIEQGKQAEYDKFWDSKKSYSSGELSYLFAGELWNDTTFRPKYDIVFISGYVSGTFQSSAITDLKAALDRAGKKLDCSRCLTPVGIWQNAKMTHCPELNLSNATVISNLFYWCQPLHTIEKLILSEKLTSLQNCFNGLAKLVNLTIEGVIPCSISLIYSLLLSVESAKSIITHLKNYKGTDKEHTQSLKLHEDVWTALETDSTSPSVGTWREYVEDDLGWTT